MNPYVNHESTTPDVEDTRASSGQPVDCAEPRQNLLAEGLTALDLSGRMARHPYQTLLIAAGVGYVLGGGLFTRLTANVLRVGVRVGALPSVQRQLFALAEAAMSARAHPSSQSRDEETHQQVRES